MFKIGEIRELIRLLDETSVSELQVESGDTKLLIRKPEVAVATTYASTLQPVPTTTTSNETQSNPRLATREAVADDTQPVDSTKMDDENVLVVTSPMVGTFYRSSSPDSDPFVQVGSHVSDKTTVCIVEAMKLMNEIEAEMSGVVVDILADNGQLVEYGQPLFKIQRA